MVHTLTFSDADDLAVDTYTRAVFPAFAQLLLSSRIEAVVRHILVTPALAATVGQQKQKTRVDQLKQATPETLEKIDALLAEG